MDEYDYNNYIPPVTRYFRLFSVERDTVPRVAPPVKKHTEVERNGN